MKFMHYPRNDAVSSLLMQFRCLWWGTGKLNLFHHLVLMFLLLTLIMKLPAMNKPTFLQE